MDGNNAPSPTGIRRAALIARARVALDSPDPIAALAQQLGDRPFALIALFISPTDDFAALIGKATDHFGDARVIGCTTAGEISADGYSDGGIVAIGFPESHFAARTVVFKKLHLQESQDVIGQVIRARAALTQTMPDMAHEFAFLLIDGLSMKEDVFASNIASGLAGVPLFGGSAGDGMRFQSTFVAADGNALPSAAVLTLIRSHCPVHVFTLNHFTPTEQRMVVTSAEPARRIVHTINAEPAARELGRIMGKDPEQIDTFTFASHPVVVRFGGDHHVRAIKQVTAEGYLEFFSAIDEGLVLSVANPKDMVAHLDGELSRIGPRGAPDTIVACDCILRRIEADQIQKSRAISDVLVRHNVIGFSTYGEQINAMHVNQTMTGVAIYPPEDNGES